MRGKWSCSATILEKVLGHYKNQGLARSGNVVTKVACDHTLARGAIDYILQWKEVDHGLGEHAKVILKIFHGTIGRIPRQVDGAKLVARPELNEGYCPESTATGTPTDGLANPVRNIEKALFSTNALGTDEGDHPIHTLTETCERGIGLTISYN
jgi:hypothetical protein